jgi:ERCC4-type nuclease
MAFLQDAYPDNTFELKALPEGDFSTEKVIVERKTLSDLYGSIVGSKGKPGRLSSQISRLSCHDKVVLVLVVGNVPTFIDDMKRLGIKVDINILYGALASLVCREQIHVMWMEKEWDALITMIRFMQKVEEGEHKVPSRRDPDVLLARYLKLTHQQWLDVKRKYKSIPELMSASDKDLMSVRGIGKVRARTIRDLLSNGWE